LTTVQRTHSGWHAATSSSWLPANRSVDLWDGRGCTGAGCWGDPVHCTVPGSPGPRRRLHPRAFPDSSGVQRGSAAAEAAYPRVRWVRHGSVGLGDAALVFLFLFAHPKLGRLAVPPSDSRRLHWHAPQDPLQRSSHAHIWLLLLLCGLSPSKEGARCHLG
jgi:hypothetical protein